MKKPIRLTKVIDPIQNSLRPSSWRYRALLIPLVLACFALSPTARAVDPPPDGGYPNGNTAEGENALFNLDTRTGSSNTAIGSIALFSDTTGSDNTAIGDNALSNNTTGSDNTATGLHALLLNTTGNNNTANGVNALLNNTTGSNNTATGFEALSEELGLSTGSFNTANGVQALHSVSTGGSNTASGYLALFANTTGSFNVANGANALQSNTTAGGNVANGGFALFSNTTGVNNVAEGFDALINNTTGNSNIAIGLSAGGNLTTGNNNIDIGNLGVAGESKRIRIGTAGTQTKTFIAGIRGVTTQNANAIPVLIDSAGQLGTVSSSRRFKKEIKPMDQTSEAILGLKPVTFHYKSDSAGTPQFGLIAEEVAQVNPDLVVRDENGEIYTVRYDAVNAMLLNEFLKEHRKVEEQAQINKQQGTTIAQQQKEIQALAATLKEHAVQIQKVSAQLETSKGRPQLVASKQ
jgi:hypothetical protein